MTPRVAPRARILATCERRTRVMSAPSRLQAGELLVAVCPPSAQVRDRIVRHRRRGEVGGRDVKARQAACRAPELRPAAVVVRMPFDEAEQDPLEPRIRRHAAFARPGRDDLRRGDAATAEMILEVQLEQDPVPPGVALAAAQHVPGAAWLLYEHVHVPGAAGQRSGEPGSRQRPPGQHRQRLVGLGLHGAAQPISSGKIESGLSCPGQG
jgi:hypothetical protein